MLKIAIKLDAAYCYHRAARIAVQRALSTSHGPEFARWFAMEHAGAIAKAARNGICGRTEAAVFNMSYRLRAQAGAA